MKTQLKADLMLLLVTFFWGASILLTKLGLDDIEEYNLIALRFIIAFLLSGLIFYKHLFKIDFKTVKYAFILASVLFIVYILRHLVQSIRAYLMRDFTMSHSHFHSDTISYLFKTHSGKESDSRNYFNDNRNRLININ